MFYSRRKNKSNRSFIDDILDPPEYNTEESDLSKFDYPEDRRPSFSDDEVEKERDSVMVIHECLAARKRTLEELLEEVNNKWKRMRPEGELLFRDAGAMETFMKQRSFLFPQKEGRFENTGFGYRDGIQQIAVFIIDHPAARGCSLVDLLDFCQEDRNFRVYDAANKEINWDDSYVFYRPVFLPQLKELLKDHPEIFKITDTCHYVKVKLTEWAFQLVSLWKWDALPETPSEAYSDASRVFTFKAKIVLSSEKGYLAANISEGIFEGRSIQFISKQMGMDSFQMHRSFPVGAEITCRAMLSLNCNCDFTGTAIELLHLEKTVDSEDDDEEAEDFHVENGRGTSSAAEPLIAGDFEAKVDHHLLARATVAEKAMIDLVDGVLGANQTYLKDIFGTVLQQNESPFSNESDILEFIENRPHLYFFEDGKAVCLDSAGRANYNVFFKFLAQFSGKGIIWDEMVNRVKAGEVGGDLQQMAYLGIFEPFVNRARRLYVKRQLLSPRETFFFPTSTYITNDEILLPNYSFGQFLV